MSIFKLLSAATLLTLAAPGLAEPTTVGQYMFNTEFRLINGQNLTGGDLRGQVVVVNFWAEDCKSCDDQLKILDYYYRQRGNVGLVMLVKSVDQVNAADLRRALNGTRLHGVRDISGDLEQGTEIPATYFIDRKGKVRYIENGVASIADLNRILVPLLREPQPKATM